MLVCLEGKWTFSTTTEEKRMQAQKVHPAWAGPDGSEARRAVTWVFLCSPKKNWVFFVYPLKTWIFFCEENKIR